MEQEKTYVSLSNLARGAAIERFDDELRRVVENILDPNADDGVREVVLRVKFTPDDNRQTASISITAGSKLQGAKPHPSLVYLGKDRGTPVAFEHNPEQLRLDLMNRTPVIGLTIPDRKEDGK